MSGPQLVKTWLSFCARGCHGAHDTRGAPSAAVVLKLQRVLSKHHRVTTQVGYEATLSTQILLDVNVRFAMSLCIGSICGGAQVVGAWQAAKGIDLALTNTDWKLRSELTSYAEYPESDSMSHAAPRRCCTSLRRP